jgi:hypothetical protein
MPHGPDFTLAHDIGQHAANEALRVFHETLDRLPNGDFATKVAGAAVAAGCLKARLDILFEGMSTYGNFTEISLQIAEHVKKTDGPKIKERADRVMREG